MVSIIFPGVYNDFFFVVFLSLVLGFSAEKRLRFWEIFREMGVILWRNGGRIYRSKDVLLHDEKFPGKNRPTRKQAVADIFLHRVV